MNKGDGDHKEFISNYSKRKCALLLHGWHGVAKRDGGIGRELAVVQKLDFIAVLERKCVETRHGAQRKQVGVAAHVGETVVQQGAGTVHGALARQAFGFGGDAHHGVGFAIHIEVAMLAHGGGLFVVAVIGGDRQAVGGVLDGDAEAVDVGGTLAQSGPVIPVVLGARCLGEYGAEHAAEFALGDGAAGLLISEMSGAIIDADEPVVLLALEVSEFQNESIVQMPLFLAGRVFVALDRFGTNEIGQ